MGRRGPQKKPTALKILEGNPGGKPLPESEPEPIGGVGDPPVQLTTVAVTEWRRLLRCCPWLTSADRGLLCAACYWWSILLAACEAADERRARDATNQYRQAADRLGLSPAARSSIVTPQKPKQKTLEEFDAETA